MPLWMRLLGSRFAKVKLDPKWVDTVREQADQGTVVHVVEVEGLLDLALLTWLLRTNRLPAISASNARVAVWLTPLLLLLFYPFVLLFRLLFRRTDRLKLFSLAMLEGKCGLIFLKRNRFVVLPGGNVGMQYLKAALEVQKGKERPIILIPHVVFWSKAPERYRRNVVDLLLSDPLAMGPRKFVNFFLNPTGVFVSCGQPVTIRELLSEGTRVDEEAIARRINWMLHRSMDLEERIVKGPMLKSATQVRDEMMLDHAFVTRVEDLGKEDGLKPKQARRRAAKCILEIAADFRIGYIEFLSLFLTPIFKRIFSSFVVDKESIRTIKEATREAPCVLVPCHRSHIDYLVISYLLYLLGVIPPHIAAGANLSFFPLGHFFRHAGAFFIRRKIGGDHIYSFVLSQYIRKLLKEGTSVEFFIEGGRSRTGKALPPRFGLLGYVAEAVCSGAVRDVTLLPVSLSYERIVEAEGYSEELTGAEKKKEDIAGLVRSAEVLDSRYGRLYLTAGRPVKIADFLRHASGKPPEMLSEEEKRYLVTRLGFLALGRINRATVVNPSAVVATVLLSHHRRGIARSRFLETAGFLVDFALKRGYPISLILERCLKAALPDIAKAEKDAEEEGKPRLADAARGHAVALALDEAIEMFTELGYVRIEEFEEGPVLSLDPSARMTLNYYRNNAIHVYQREALLALALYARRHEHVIPLAEVLEDIAFLSRMLKREFIFRVGQLRRGAQAGLSALEADGLIRPSGTEAFALVPAGMDRLLLFRNMVLPVVESYLICARYSPVVRWRGAMRPKDLARAVLSKARKDYKEGEITCQEALSSVAIANAIEQFTSMNVLKLVDSGVDAGKIRFARGSEIDNLGTIERRLSALVEV